MQTTHSEHHSPAFMAGYIDFENGADDAPPMRRVADVLAYWRGRAQAKLDHRGDDS